MGQSLSSKDWIRMLIAFLLGVAVSLLVMQLTSGGTLFQGYLDGSGDYGDRTTTDSTVDPGCGDGKCNRLETLEGSCPQDCDPNYSEVDPRSSEETCGDGYCAEEETELDCPADCGVYVDPRCGDGKCNKIETLEGSCPQDCGTLPAESEPTIEGTCGDGFCVDGETELDCPADCGLSSDVIDIEEVDYTDVDESADETTGQGAYGD